LFEKFFKHLATFLCRYAALNVYPMIRLVQGNLHNGTDRPGFRILCAKNKSSDPGLNHRPQAHSAWFKGDVQIAILEPIVADFSAGPSDGDNLGVGRRVTVPDGLIVSAADDFPARYNHRPDRHFPFFFCLFSFGQGPAHECGIVFEAGRIFRFHQESIVPAPIQIYNGRDRDAEKTSLRISKSLPLILIRIMLADMILIGFRV
jgi:hypothetical protein